MNYYDINISEIPKTLIYITTHMSQHHKDFLKYCWPLSISNSKLLSSADIMVYLTPNPGEEDESIQILNETFKGNNLSYYIKENLGYHEGAKDALMTASDNGWFKEYE